MSGEPANIFWDSCVIIRYLTEHPRDYVDDIGRFLEDAKQGVAKIHVSTICFTEIRPQYLRQKGYGDIHDFFRDFEGAFATIDTNPNILTWAGTLRDPSYNHPRKKARVVGTADAIHLMTCVYAKTVLGIGNIVFHTLDDGKSRNSEEGRCVPLLSFEEWTSGLEANELVQSVVDLRRERPIHPQPGFNI